MANQLKTLKTIDVIAQPLMVIIPLLLSRLKIHFLINGAANIVLMLGCWQVLSFLIHLTQNGKSWLAKGRKWYGRLLLALLLMGAVVFISNDFQLLYFFILLLVSIGMAIQYFMMSADEVIKISLIITKAS